MELHWQLPEGATRRFLAIAAIVVVIAAGYWWMSAPVASVPVRVETAPTTAASAALYVDVAGAVRTPGVVRLPVGARVFDAIEAAGGLRSGVVAGVNLARVVVDGEQIVVGAPVAVAGGGAVGGRLNLNSADAAALEGLDGIGPVLARRIVEYREAHGPFREVRQLLDVPGVGDAKYAAIADRVAVG